MSVMGNTHLSTNLSINKCYFSYFTLPLFSSVRRGYEVYKQVCKACHSLQYIAFRNLVNVTHTEAEAKAEAADVSTTAIHISACVPVLSGMGAGQITGTWAFIFIIC